MNDDIYAQPIPGQSGQSAPPASESFGDFGPLPEVGPPVPFVPSPIVPLPGQAGSYQPQPGQAGPDFPNPVMPQPGQMTSYPPVAGQQLYYYPPSVPASSNAFQQAVPRIKVPIRFPLVRNMPAYLQIFEMLCYSLLMALVIMGLVLSLYHNYQSGLSTFVNSDGTTINGLAILLVIILALLIIPACSLLAGALFGSWRGLIVSCGSVFGGLLISHISNPVFWNMSAVQGYLFLAPFPLAALVVGWVYERRKYAAWWRSMFTMMLGAGIISLWLAILLIIVDLNSPTVMESLSTSTSPQAFMAGLWVAGGCIFIGLIPLLTFPITCIEGIIHASLAAAASKK